MASNLGRIAQDEINASEQEKKAKAPNIGSPLAFTDKQVKEGQRLATINYIPALANLPNPQQIPSLMVPRKESVLGSDLSGAGKLIQGDVAAFNDFADSLERAYYTNRGKVPAGWLLKQDPDDLKFFSDPDLADAVGPNLLSQGLALWEHYESQRALEEKAEARFQEEMRRLRSLDTPSLYAPEASFLAERLDKEQGRLSGGAQADALLDERLPGKNFRQEDLDAILHPPTPDDTPTFLGTGLEFFGTAWKGAEQMVTIATSPLAGDPVSQIQGALGPEISRQLWGDDLRIKDNDEVAQARKQLEQMRTGDIDGLKDQVMRGMLPTAVWEQLPLSDKEEYNRMYGEDLAYMGFLVEFQDMRDNPDIDAQLEDWVTEGIVKPAEDHLRYLEEENYRSSTSILDFLDTYGNITMGLAAGATAVFLDATGSDQELVDEITNGGAYWDNIAKTVDEGGHTPSGVLGLEGTILGVAADFLGGMLFDPTNLFFLPGAKGGINALASQRAIRQIVRSPGMKMYLNDIPKLLADNAGNTLGKASALAPYAEVGLAGDIMAAAGYSDNVLPAKPWLTGAKGAVTREMDLSAVVGLLDDVQAAEWLDLGGTVDDLGRSLRNTGFKEPIQIAYDPTTQTIKVEDGLKRLRAAQEMGDLKKVPVTVRVIPEAVEHSTLPRPLVDEIQASPESFVYHGTNRIAPEVLEDMMLGNDEFTRGGLTGDRTRAESYADTTRPISGSAQGLEGADDVVLIFRKDDLPLKAQRQLERGEDVEELFPSGDFTQFDPVRPVGWYTKTEGFPGVAQTIKGGRTLEELGQNPLRRIETRLIDKAEFTNPTSLFSDKFLGVTADKAAVARITEQVLEMGGDVPMARQTWAAVGMGQFVRQLSKGLAADAFLPYLKTTFNSDFVPVGAVGGTKRLMEFVDFIGTHDAAFTQHWLQRILEQERIIATSRAGRTEKLVELVRLRELDKLIGNRTSVANGWREIKEAGLIPEEALTNIVSNEQMRDLIHENIRGVQQAIRELPTERTGWQELVTEMMEDYNRQHIATHPEWAADVGPDGLVPWSAIHRGASTEEAGFLSQSTGRSRSLALEKEADEISDLVGSKYGYEAGDAERVFGQFMGSDKGIGVRLPATPIELIAASEAGGAKYTRWTQEIYAQQLRTTLHLTDAMWKANVLMTPRTFMVMSIDELMTMSHMGGYGFVGRYLQTRADVWGARANSFLREGQGLRVRPGTRHLPDRAIERIRKLKDVPYEFRAYERFLAESLNNEVIYMNRKDLGYSQAAEVYAQQYVDNPAFRAYLAGPDAFKEWWKTSKTAEEWRMNNQIITVDPNGDRIVRPYASWKEGYQAADLTWQRLEQSAVREGLEDPAEFRRSFTETAAKIDADTSGRTYTVPEWTWDYFGPIPGRRPVYPGASLAWDTVSRVFEAGAANPANFRQGLAAEMMRRNESARLHKLFESQGRKVLTDAETIELLRQRGINPMDVDPLTSSWLDKELAAQGVYTESWVARLAEQRARDFVDDMTYSFEQGSRFGRSGSVVAPFGRAWGDMYARWGKALFSRATLRPWTQKLGIVNEGLQFLADLSPVNPRTAGFISRVAALDMNITGGFMGESETELDFSPLTFLPTAGNGGLSTIIPGLGPVPIMSLDWVIEQMFDPVEDPQAYQQVIDHISDIVPAMSLHGRQWWQRVSGSGLVGLALNSATDLSMGLFHNNNRTQGRFTGNLGQELRRSRAVSAQFADPEFMDWLLTTNDPEAVTLLLAAAWRDGNQAAATLGLTDNLSSFAVPVRGANDPSLDELYNVWIDVARSQPDIFGTTASDSALKGNDALAKQTGDRARRIFYELPGWQRELLIAENPTLAVNMISTWEWSTSAPLSLPDRDVAYAVGRSSVDGSLGESLDRHNVYVQRGWVVPRDTAVRGHQILGRALSARQNIARTLYEESAATMNDVIWEAVLSEESRSNLDLLVNLPEFTNIGITEPRQLWERWSTNKEVLEDLLMEEAGMERNTEEGDAFLERIRDAFRIPEEEQAWSTEWRGDDMAQFSQRTREFPILLNDTARTIIETLDLDIEEGMSGENFIQTIIDYRSGAEGAAWYAVKNQYEEYRDDRGRARASALQSLTDLSQNRTLDERELVASGWRNQLDDFMKWAEVQNENSFHGGISRSVQEEAVDRFMRLSTSGKDAPVIWDNIWRDAFQTTFGPLNWEPPVPLTPMDESGEVRTTAWKPYVQAVLDGDTLLVSENSGPKIVNEGMFAAMHGTGAPHKVRILGVMAADYGGTTEGTPEQAATDQARLEDAIRNAQRNGDSIWLVRDPEYAGSHTDPFGRELAWLWIGDTPYYFPDELRRGEG